MNKNFLNIFCMIFFLVGWSFSVSAEMGVPVQVRLKSPTGVYPNETGVSIKVLVLSQSGGCVLREEDFAGQSVVNGAISLNLGSGTRGSMDPNISLNQIFSNAASKSGLTCVDADNNVVSTGQIYTPASDHHRLIRLVTSVSGDPINVTFNMKSVPYAIQAESVGGKSGADILVQNGSTQLSQSSLESLLADLTHFNNLKNFASSGAVANSNTAVNFSGSLSGDVTGTQSATSVNRIRGVAVSASAPAAGQALIYDGTQYSPTSLPSAPVTSVAGKTGAVTLSSSDISGLGNVLTTATTFAGDVSGEYNTINVDTVGGKSSSDIAQVVEMVAAATSSNTANTIVKRDASGNVVMNNVSSQNLSSNNLYLYSGANYVQVKAPAGLSANYVLNLPADDGLNGQVLTSDGAGNLAWSTVAAGGVTSVSASAPLSSSGGATPNISMTAANATTAGYLTAADWNTFNSKQNALLFTPLDSAQNLADVSSVAAARTNLGLGAAAVANVGTTAGTVAAGDDSRITGALQSSSYNTDVSGASSCTTVQTPYWNSISDQWLCQNISFPADAVSSVAGKTGAVTLASSDISGLGTASTLNFGVAAGNAVQLDGSARIPASTLPSNALTTTSAFSGDVTGTSSSMSVDRIRGVAVNATAPTAGQALVYNGSEWVPTTGFPSFAVKPSSQVFTAIGVANVTGLSFAVTAGVKYKYKFQILYTSAATTTGLRLGLTYPAATVAVALANISSGADGTGAYFQGTINTSGDSVLSTATSSTSANGHIAFVEGIIVPSANGTVQLTAATEVAASAITILANSLVEVTQVP